MPVQPRRRPSCGLLHELRAQDPRGSRAWGGRAERSLSGATQRSSRAQAGQSLEMGLDRAASRAKAAPRRRVRQTPASVHIPWAFHLLGDLQKLFLSAARARLMRERTVPEGQSEDFPDLLVAQALHVAKGQDGLMLRLEARPRPGAPLAPALAGKPVQDRLLARVGQMLRKMCRRPRHREPRRRPDGRRTGAHGA